MKIRNAVKIATIRLAGYTGKTLQSTTLTEEQRINHKIDKAGTKIAILLVTISWIIMLTLMKFPT